MSKQSDSDWIWQKQPRRSGLFNRSRRRSLAAISIFVLLSILLVLVGLWLQPEGFDQRNEFVRTIAQIIAGAALLLGLYFTSENLENSRRTLQHQQDAKSSDRFYDAIEQLTDKNEGVRLGALFALRSLYRASSLDREAILQVVVAYIKGRSEITEDGDDAGREVEHALTVLGQMLRSTNEILRAHSLPVQLNLNDLNFRGLQVDDGRFTGVSFANSDFSSARFMYCEFFGSIFVGSRLWNVHFHDCDMNYCLLIGADLAGADLSSCKNLHWLQINESRLTNTTKLPDYLLADKPEWYEQQLRGFAHADDSRDEHHGNGD